MSTSRRCLGPFVKRWHNLKLLLTRFGVSLESMEAYTRGGVGLVSTQASLPLDSTDLKSSVVEEEQLYGLFLSLW
jgi:hypothetical protein